MTTYEHLMTGLVGEHDDLYMTNAIFKNNIDTVAQLIPILVDGLAVKANIEYEKMETAIRLAEQGIRGDEVVLDNFERMILDRALDKVEGIEGGLRP